MASYDVIISGAGPAGSTAALVLARAGARVLLLDRAAFPRDKPCAEYLSPEINVILRDLGLTAAVAALRPAYLRGFRVYPQDGHGFTGTFAGSCAGVAERRLGLAVPRLSFDNALVEAATGAGADLHERARVTGLLRNGPDVALRIQYGTKETTLEAGLVLAADGLRSPITRALRLSRRAAPYRIALVTHMSGIEELDDYGEMHASPAGGYCGIAPLGDGRANVAMVVDEREGRRVAGDPAGYLRGALALYPRLARRVRQAALCRPVLTTSGLSWSVGRFRVACIGLAGDATGYYDPFTGEGIYRAMAGGRLAGHWLCKALANGAAEEALAQYERELRGLYRGKRLVERIIDSVVHRPLLFQLAARRFKRHPEMADILVGVTGDYLSPRAMLNPVYPLRLLLS